MNKLKTLKINEYSIFTFTQNSEDFISLTDMAWFKNAETTGIVIAHWLSTCYTVGFMGLWEKKNNPQFNVTEFSYIKNEIGSNGFVLSAIQWIDNPDSKGNEVVTFRINGVSSPWFWNGSDPLISISGRIWPLKIWKDIDFVYFKNNLIWLTVFLISKIKKVIV